MTMFAKRLVDTRAFIQFCLVIAVLLVVLIQSTTVWSQDTLQNSGFGDFSRPGGVAIVDFDTESNAVPSVHFGSQRIAVVRSLGGWRAFVGLDTNLIPGDYVIKISTEEKRLTAAFRVHPPHSPQHDLRAIVDPTLAPDSLRQAPQKSGSLFKEQPMETSTTPLPAMPDCARFAIKSTWRDASLGVTYLEIPVPLRSSRLVQPARLVQPGVWLQIDVSATVNAPTGGLVSAVNPPGSLSTALVIDHGQRVTSILCPVINPLVTVDAELTRGQPLGEVAGDGRLWWTIIINGQAINPLTMTTAAMPR